MQKQIFVLLIFFILVFGCTEIIQQNNKLDSNEALFGEIWIYGDDDCIFSARFYDKDTNVVYEYMGPASKEEIDSLSEEFPQSSHEEVMSYVSSEWSAVLKFKLDKNKLITGLIDSVDTIKYGSSLTEAEFFDSYLFELTQDKLVLLPVSQDENFRIDYYRWIGNYDDFKKAIEASKVNGCFRENLWGFRYEPNGFFKLKALFR